MKNRTITNEPITKLVANIFFSSGSSAFPYIKGKFEIDGYFPPKKANHLFKDDMKGFGLLSLTSIKNEFNSTIYVNIIIYVAH